MKIGIISINAYTTVLNHACPVHSYAFQRFLDNHGIDNVIINYLPAWHDADYAQKVFDPYSYSLEHPLEDEEKQEKVLKKWKKLSAKRVERARNRDRFVDEHLRMTEKKYNKFTLDTEDPGCDIYICVTDVLWKYEPLYGFDKGFFLDCEMLKGKGKISYAASKGPSIFTPEQETEFFEHLKSFHYISCRERSLYDFVRTRRKASVVLDPVFLHEPSFYDPICVKPKEEHFLLIYTVMQQSHELIQAACAFAEKKGLTVIDVSDDKNILYGAKRFKRVNRYECSIEEWLGYIRYADYVFTNSFHGTCLSILFHTAFYTGKRSGDKVDWVQRLFGLSWRNIVNTGEIIDKPIPWGKVDKLRTEYKKCSEQFILRAIEETAKALNDETYMPEETEGIESTFGRNIPDLYEEEGFFRRLIGFFRA